MAAMLIGRSVGSGEAGQHRGESPFQRGGDWDGAHRQKGGNLTCTEDQAGLRNGYVTNLSLRWAAYPLR